MNELYKKIYNQDEDEIADPIQWLVAIYHTGVLMGEYRECEDMSAEEAYEYGLGMVEDMLAINKDNPYNYQVYIRPATMGDLEA